MTPDLVSVETALANGTAVGLYVLATTEFYAPVACSDGSYEVSTPGTNYTIAGGHFITAVAYDNTRKMKDGTTGGIKIQNSWGTGWAQQGFAWLSTAGWVTSNRFGNLTQAYTILATSPANPLTFTGNFPTTIPPGAILNVAWTSNGDSVVVSDVLWHYSATLPASGTFMTGVAAGDVWTFKSSRKSDGSTLTKTVPVSN